MTGWKNSKERITVLVGGNMSFREKLKLLLIGKLKRPRCIKGLRSLEVDYKYNNRAWMTGEIYEKWHLKLQKCWRTEKENCTFCG